MTNDTIVFCPTCEGAGRIMEGRLYPSGHTEVWEECSTCNGLGDMTFEEFQDLDIKEKPIEVNPVINNFPIH